MTYVWNKARDRAIRSASTPKSTIGAQMIVRPCGYCGQRPHAPKCPVPRYEEPEDGVIEMPSSSLVQVPRQYEAIETQPPLAESAVGIAAPSSMTPAEIEQMIRVAVSEQYRQQSQMLAAHLAAERERTRQMAHALAVAQSKLEEFKSKPDFVWNDATQSFHEVVYDSNSGRASIALSRKR